MSAVETHPAIPYLPTPEERVEGREKVTGHARYAMDVPIAGALWAAFVGSPYPHARVVRVDAKRALRMRGVRAVISGKDTAPVRFGRRLQDWPILAHDRVRFMGERVAAVAADTRELAEEAARAIEVEYEELPPVFTLEAALSPEAPILHPERASYLYLGGGEPPKTTHPNQQGVVIHEHGDVAAGFAAAARVFEHTFEYARNHQGYLEPRGTIVWIEKDGVVHVVTTNKAPFTLRMQLSKALGIPEETIVVDAGYIGGDFGGKGLSIDEPALYFLAKKTRRPVRSLLSLSDDFQVTNPRHPGTLRLRTAVDAEGRILAHEAHVLLDGGAYAAGKPQAGLIPGDAGLLLAGYRVPAARVEVVTVYTNNEPAGHVRSPGQPQSAFAADSQIDEIAREMGIDPLEIRLRNAIQPGETDITGHEWHDHLAREVLETLAREMKWDRPLEQRSLGASALDGPAVPRSSTLVGRGIGYCARHVGRGKTELEVEVAEDGCVYVITGAPDQGGGAHTMLQRVVAAELGLPVERVRARRGTTAETRHDPGVGGSRFTPVAGGAAIDGARRLRAELEKLSPDLDEALRLAAERHLRVPGMFDQTQSRYSVCAYGVTVAVDRDTGQFRVTDAVLVADVGTVINPVAHRGQLEGAFAFGLGQTVMEDLVIEDGRVVTANLDGYKLPTMPDVPPLRIVLLTEDYGPGPFGAKSVGELANAAVGPAVANAVRDAIGRRVWSCPITSEKVFEALSGARG
ncbi:MAG: xanthine dehydrogenase family protein molybdopterin-binding subunit [Chloroflexota bacterium]|nr:xanthine dehydrogenase family protein molybdopterin-binding subunit [Chloroflexota bacterium]